MLLLCLHQLILTQYYFTTHSTEKHEYNIGDIYNNFSFFYLHKFVGLFFPHQIMFPGFRSAYATFQLNFFILSYEVHSKDFIISLTIRLININPLHQ